MENKTYKTMTALEFLKEAKRMCLYYNGDCRECDANDNIECVCNIALTSDSTESEYEKAVQILYNWSKQHPVKTIADMLYEAFPEALKSSDGIPMICPRFLYKNFSNCVCNVFSLDSICNNCMRNFWSKEAS